jgi:hypothetical protein
VTPSEKPRTGSDAEPEPDSGTVIVTTEETAPADPAVEANGHAEPQVASEDDDQGVGHGAPPPWQRMSNDTTQPPSSSSETAPVSDVLDGEPTAVTTDDRTSLATWPVEDEPVNELGAEDTVRVERPFGTSPAAGLFDGAAPGHSQYHGAGFIPVPPRTPVHLEGATPTPGRSRSGMAPPSALRRSGRGPRRANLQVKRFDPWSVLKLSLVLGIALFFVWLVAVGALYAVLDGMGVWDKVNGISTELLQQAGSTEPLISAGRVFGIAAIIGAINIVLFSALATVGAFVYNVSADLAGGLEVTLAERE